MIMSLTWREGSKGWLQPSQFWCSRHMLPLVTTRRGAVVPNAAPRPKNRRVIIAKIVRRVAAVFRWVFFRKRVSWGKFLLSPGWLVL